MKRNNQGAKILGRRFKLWWSGKENKIEGIGIHVKEELYENVVEIIRISNRVMVIALVSGNKVIRVVSAYATQCGKNLEEKEQFYCEMAKGCGDPNKEKFLICLGDFNGHVGEQIDGFDGVHGGFGVGERNVESRLLLLFCDRKDLCVANIWFEKKENMKIKYNGGLGRRMEIDFVLVGRRDRKHKKDVKTILGEYLHKLLVIDSERKKVKSYRLVKKRVWSLKVQNSTKSSFFILHSNAVSTHNALAVYVISTNLGIRVTHENFPVFFGCLVYSGLDLLVKLILLFNGCHIGRGIALNNGNFSAL